jgi:hypothetical protein
MTTPSNEEIAAAFVQAFAGIVPSEKKQIPVAEKLAPYRELILAKRAEGYSWRQIAERMKHPAINIKVSHMTLRVIFGKKPKKGARKVRPAVQSHLGSGPTAPAITTGQ